jgi:DNA-binding transcriptional regulator YiaG
MTSTSTLNQRITTLRESLGLSIEKFSAMLEVHHSTVRRWETGSIEIPPKNVRKIVTVCGVSAAWLEKGEGGMFPNPRLTALREAKRLSEEQLADKIGIHHWLVRHWETGVTRLDLDNARLLGKLFEVSPDWLMTGKGEMVPEDQTIKARVERIVGISLLRAHPKCEGGRDLTAFEYREDCLGFDKHWLRRVFNVPHESLRMFEVDGDEMKPTLAHGELVFVDITSPQNRLKEGVWIMKIDSLLCVKRLKRVGKEYKAVSDNADHEPIALDDTAIPMAYVIGGLRRY